VDLVGDLVIERCGVEHGGILANAALAAQAQLPAGATGTIFSSHNCYGHSVCQVHLCWKAPGP